MTSSPSPVSLHLDGAVARIVIDAPPVNAISRAVIAGLQAAWEGFQASDAKAVVIACAGRSFVAGGDIALFEDTKFTAAPLNALLARIEASERPVVAALHGSTLGGGLELAMAAHARVAAPATKLGMPEITLGLIPGSLGTQRLPRLASLALAAQMIQSGKPVSATQALEAGLIDDIADDSAKGAAALAQQLIGQTLRRASALDVSDAAKAESILKPLFDAAARQPHLPALRAAYEALQAAATLPYARGAEIEAEVFAAIIPSPVSKSLRHVFFAERAAQKVAGIDKSTPRRPLSTFGVLGAGTMGAGIATALANGGYPAILVDSNAEALARGMDRIAADYAGQVKKGRLSEAEAETRRARITGASDIAALAQVDMVIEAVFENMALKCNVIAALAQTCKPNAIIATNTSTLDVDRIAAASGRASDVIGTHFFSPAQIMRLLEIVRGKDTAPDVLASVMDLARRIGKTAVVTGVCYGFIGNRMAEVYMRESEQMQMEGASAAQIDAVAEAPAHLGMAMGPSRMLDMAGVDVGALTVIEWIASGAGPQEPSYRALCRAMFEGGAHGQKTGAGYYRYEGRAYTANEDTAALARRLGAEHGIVPRTHSDREILERLLYPMINEAALILGEGIAERASDIDVVWTAGYGFPAWRGGPLFMADTIGAGAIVEALQSYGEALGNMDGRWTPAPLLQDMAASGSSFTLIDKG